MALRWSWKEKCGTALAVWYDGDERKTGNLSLYQGNAELIFLWESGESYTMFSFWADRDHMKNCLGLTKGNSNIYSDDSGNRVKIIEFTFYKNRIRDLPQIVTAIVKAFPRISINIEEAYDDEAE